MPTDAALAICLDGRMVAVQSGVFLSSRSGVPVTSVARAAEADDAMVQVHLAPGDVDVPLLRDLLRRQPEATLARMVQVLPPGELDELETAALQARADELGLPVLLPRITGQAPATPADALILPREHLAGFDPWRTGGNESGDAGQLPPIDNTVALADIVHHELVDGTGAFYGVVFPSSVDDRIDMLRWPEVTRQDGYLIRSYDGTDSHRPLPGQDSGRPPLSLDFRTSDDGMILLHRRAGNVLIRVDGSTVARLAVAAGLLAGDRRTREVISWSGIAGPVEQQIAAGLRAHGGHEAGLHAPEGFMLVENGQAVINGAPIGAVVLPQPVPEPDLAAPVTPRPAVSVTDAHGTAMGVAWTPDEVLVSNLATQTRSLSRPYFDNMWNLDSGRTYTLPPWAGLADHPGGRPLLLVLTVDPTGTGFEIPDENGGVRIVPAAQLPDLLHQDPVFRAMNDGEWNRPIVLMLPGVPAFLTGRSRAIQEEMRDFLTAVATEFNEAQAAAYGYRRVFFHTGELHLNNDPATALAAGVSFGTRYGDVRLVREPQLADVVVAELPDGRGLSLPVPGVTPEVAPGSPAFAIAAAGNGRQVWARSAAGPGLVLLSGANLGAIVQEHPAAQEAAGTRPLEVVSPAAGALDEAGRVGHDFVRALPSAFTLPVLAPTGAVTFDAGGRLDGTTWVGRLDWAGAHTVPLLNNWGFALGMVLVGANGRRGEVPDAIQDWVRDFPEVSSGWYEDLRTRRESTPMPWGTEAPFVVVLDAVTDGRLSVQLSDGTGDDADLVDLGNLLRHNEQFWAVPRVHAQHIWVAAPANVSAAQADRLGSALQADLRAHGLHREVTVTVGAQLADLGRIGAPAWSRTWQPDPVRPDEIDVHELRRTDGTVVGASFPTRVGDLPVDAAFVLGGGGAVTNLPLHRARNAGKPYAVIAAHGNAGGFGVRLRGAAEIGAHGDLVQVQGDTIVDTLAQAGILRRLPATEFGGYLLAVCSIMKELAPQDPAPSMVRRLRELGDDLPVLGGDSRITVNLAGRIRAEDQGSFHEFPARSAVQPALALRLPGGVFELGNLITIGDVRNDPVTDLRSLAPDVSQPLLLAGVQRPGVPFTAQVEEHVHDLLEQMSWAGMAPVLVTQARSIPERMLATYGIATVRRTVTKLDTLWSAFDPDGELITQSFNGLTLPLLQAAAAKSRSRIAPPSAEVARLLSWPGREEIQPVLDEHLAVLSGPRARAELTTILGRRPQDPRLAFIEPVLDLAAAGRPTLAVDHLTSAPEARGGVLLNAGTAAAPTGALISLAESTAALTGEPDNGAVTVLRAIEMIEDGTKSFAGRSGVTGALAYIDQYKTTLHNDERLAWVRRIIDYGAGTPAKSAEWEQLAQAVLTC